MKVCLSRTGVVPLVSVVLFCLAGFRHRLVRGVDARSSRTGSQVTTPPVNSQPQTCSTGQNLELTGAKTSFNIHCPKNLKLAPVEAQISAVAQEVQQQQNLDKAYRVTAAASGGAGQQCATGAVETLETLAPGSTLNVAKKGMNKQRAQDKDQVDGENTATLFTLELGDRQEEEKHFCYTCTDSKGQRLEAATSCSIFVKVPKKENPSPENPPAGSGSSSPSLLAWLTLSVAGCVVGLMHHS